MEIKAASHHNRGAHLLLASTDVAKRKQSAAFGSGPDDKFLAKFTLEAALGSVAHSESCKLDVFTVPCSCSCLFSVRRL